VAGTIIADVIQSDQSYPSSINIASPVIISNTFAFPAGTVSAPAFFPTGDTNTGIFFPAADTMAFAEGGVEAMRIDSSGRVGIGTSSPSERLDVQTTAGRFTVKALGGSSLELNSDNAIKLKASVNDVILDGASNIIFDIADAEKMRIDSGGNLLVGRTAYVGLTTDGLYFGKSFNHWSLTSEATYVNRNGTDGSVFIFTKAAGGVGSISVTASATTYNTSSDYRLKENIAPMTGALEKIAQLKPCTYTWKVNGSAGQGFIAHELQEVVPDCVTGEKDAVETYTDEEGVEQTRPVYQGIDTSFLVATLTAAIQELKAELDTVKSELATLKGN
jgi:hypothetical protein